MYLKNQKDTIDILSKSIKIYDKNLKNKKILFILESAKNKIESEEVFFGKRNFYHLTGIKATQKNGKELSANNFYDLLLKNRLNPNNITKKNNTTDLKLQVLQQLMYIDRAANMIGEYDEDKIILKTEKIAGNVKACMGFIKDKKMNIYIPNTALKEDIRQITTERNKIVAILKKDLKDELYKNITFIKKNYEIIDILKNNKINKILDIKNLYSYNKEITNKIDKFKRLPMSNNGNLIL